MFSRLLVRPSRFSRRVVRPVSWAMAAVMGAGLIQVAIVPEAAEAAGKPRPGTAASPKPLPKRDPLPVKPRKADPAAGAAAKPAQVSWPAAGAAEIAVPAAAAARSAKASSAKAGGLPVTVAAAPAASAARGVAAVAPGKVRVEVLDRTASEQARVDGPVLRVSRADGRTGPGAVQLGLGYAGIAGAFGGDFGARLRLVKLPECALTTPGKAECAGTPVATTNDGAAKTLSAPAETGALFAMAAADSSSQGNYGATALSPSSKWSVAPSTGGFSWSYPMQAPPVPGGGAPSVTLGYSSQSVDGRTATTNNQGSWVGEGFTYEPGYVERRYKACSDDGHDQYADQCWAYDNATLMLNGKSTELVKDGSTWRLADDDGSKVERLTGATNGDNDGEHWRVTTPNGSEYYFGLNRLPGWSSGKEETKSAWTVPIFGDDKDEPCYHATFTSAHCDQGWRWNLDYVKDRYGNVSSYFYAAETNHYARGKRTEVNGVPYVRGGWLRRIDYGQRHNAVYSTDAPARVRFDAKERCLPTANMNCEAKDLTTANASHWPDVPFDRNCAENVKCKADQIMPTFWTRARLAAITTEIRGATDWSPVDQWKLNHLFTDNGDGSRTLWLQSITHVGLAGGSIEQPAVVLGGLQMPNRIDRDGDFVAPLIRFRLGTVWTDTGGQIDVNYAKPDCTQSSLPSPGRSTRRCYPVKWSPLGSGDPITDWFHKYVVEQVIETDRTGGAPDMVTRYEYLDGAAWRHVEPDGIGDPKDDTWSEWRGYGRVRVTAGDGQTQRTKTEYRYLRGLNGDKDPDGGTRPADPVEDSTGAKHNDHDEVSGHELESIVYDGSTAISKKITTPWRHNTATETHRWGSKKAWFINTAGSRSLVALAAGGWRETAQTSTYETTFGRVTQSENQGDVGVTGDEACTRTSYVDNPDGYLYGLVSRVESVSVKCSATPDRRTQVISDTRTLYDGKAFGVAPTLGNPTRTERLQSHNGTTGTYIRASEGTFDAYGRPLTAADALGSTTTNVYTETNGLTTQVKETNPLGFVTTTNYAPAWGSPVSQVDPNGLLSELEYDALGRLTKVWLPDRSGLPRLEPSIKYTYLIRTDKPVAIKTEKRQGNGTYSVEYKLHDGHLRPRQVQSEGPDGTRTVADTFYTATGKLAKTYATYTAAGAPSDQIFPAVNGDVNGQTLYVYDGADRVKAEIFAVAGNEKWRTSTTYGGDRTAIDPPDGGTPTMTITNALGQTTQRLQYKGSGPSGDFDRTEYTYTSNGQLATVKDPAGNVWRHEYDQLGRKTKSIDPDSGTSTAAYDDLDRVTGTTTGLATLSTTYDEIGRKTAVHKGAAGTGELLSSWTYDEEMLGYVSSASRFTGGAEYKTYYGIYDEFYRPHGTYFEVPEAAGAELAGMYTFGTEYNRDGTIQSTTMSEGGGLPFETIVYQYDNLERLTGMIGDAAYLTDVDYASTGEVMQTEAVVGGKKVWSTYEYEQGSKRLTRQRLDRQMAPVIDVDARYTYDPSGNIQRIADNPSGTRDTQCFTYDYLRRMDRAWTSASTAADPCEGGPAATGVGGVAPYHHEYTFDAVGNRKTEKQYATDGTSLIERSYSYPAAGGAQPHTLDTMTEKTPSGEKLHEYDYDVTGNTTRRAKAGEGQTLAWDAEGNLESVTDAAGKKTSYLYDVDGSRMLRKEPTQTTLYLPGMEVRLNHQTRATDTTRYYGLPGGSQLVRKNDGLRYVANDHHGTGNVTVDSNGAVTHRRTTPYGEARGTQPAAGVWPTEKGFVGGNQDSTTGLTNIGAREYDTVTGRFISIDPIIDVNDPQQMNGYAYANNNPISFSDPDGLKFCSDDACGPGADYVDSTGEYHEVAGHNDGCGGCSGAKDPTVHNNPRASPDDGNAAAKAAAERERQARIARAKQKIVDVAKALGKILADELGITDAMNCFLKGDMGGCVNTAVNVLSSVVGGAVGKLAARYGAPWKWKKLANLTSRVKGLLTELVDGVKGFFKATKDCNSFAPGTLVLMANGKKKPIEKVKPGEKVLATDPVTKRTKARPVVATHINLDAAFTDLVINTAGKKSLIETTAHHRFWSKDRQDWVNAANLKKRENLLTVGGGAQPTVSAATSYSGAKFMHDLTVDTIHTYYVLADTTPVLVHNCDWTSDGNLFDHFDKHVLGVGKKGGVGDMAHILESNGGNVDDALEEYASCAQRFLCGAAPAGAREKRRESDGALVRVDTETGELGILGDEGIVTYFKSEEPIGEYLKLLQD